MAAKKRSPKGGDLPDTASNKTGGNEPALSYMVLKANTITELELAVVGAMKNGWTCQGGIFALSPMYYAQAMVK
jgi:hypothetical protein